MRFRTGTEQDFMFTFHMAQLSCFMLQAKIPLSLSAFSFPCPRVTCTIIHSPLASFSISIFWEMKEEKWFPLPQLYLFISHVFQGGVGPVRICPSFMLFSH